MTPPSTLSKKSNNYWRLLSRKGSGTWFVESYSVENKTHLRELKVYPTGHAENRIGWDFAWILRFSTGEKLLVFVQGS